LRILLIVFFLILPNFSYSDDEVKWKFKKLIEHETYYEAIAEGKIKKIINGKEKKVKLMNKHFYPLKEKTDRKEWKCKPWQIEEISVEGKYITRSYVLHDCLPCLDAGSGHLCSYPHFSIFFFTDLYEVYYYREDINDILNHLKSDGTIKIVIQVNIGSRERVHIRKTNIDLSSLSLPDGIERYHSRIVKYNTRLRKILSETTDYTLVKDYKYKLVFDRIAGKAYELLSNPGELKIREKDLKILFSMQPGASIYKYQTRD